MVYVFGVEIPLIEVMLAVIVLIFIMLIITFLEVRKLRKLIKIESTDIVDLEAMKGDPVDKFIASAIEKGYKKKDVIATFKKAGWSDGQIKKAMAKFP